METVCLCRSLCKTSFSICIALTTAETERSGSLSHTFFRVAESGLSGRLNGPATKRRKEYSFVWTYKYGTLQQHMFETSDSVTDTGLC